MAKDEYSEYKALNPFFDVVMKGLNGSQGPKYGFDYRWRYIS